MTATPAMTDICGPKSYCIAVGFFHCLVAVKRPENAPNEVRVLRNIRPVRNLYCIVPAQAVAKFTYFPTSAAVDEP
jgi:hypothetical protein